MSIISNTIYLNTDPKTLRTRWTGGYAHALIKIKAPDGTIVYQTNTDAYDTDDWANSESGATYVDTDMYVDSNDDIVPGTYTVYYKLTNSIFAPVTPLASGSVQFYACEATMPTISIGTTHSCFDSELTIVDNTDYTLTIGSSSAEPSSFSTEMTIKYPLTIISPDTRPDDIVETSSTPLTVIVPPNLWTGIFTILLESECTWTFTQSDGSTLYVVETLSDATTHDVVCATDCFCTLLTCVNVVIENYKTALENDGREAARLLPIITQINSRISSFLAAMVCGNEDIMTSTCSELQELIDSTNCTCVSTTTSKSTEVIPVNAGSGSGTTTTLNNIIIDDYPTPPSDEIGNNSDLAFDNGGTGNVYRKLSGTWSFQFSLLGATGSTTDPRYRMLEYPDFTAVGTDADKAKKLLKSKSLDLSEVTDGSKVRFEVCVTVGNTDDVRNVFLELKNTSKTQTILQDVIEYDVDSYNDTIFYIVELMLKSETTQLINIIQQYQGYDLYQKKSQLETTFDTSTLELEFNVYGQGTNSTANDVQVEYVYCELFESDGVS